MLKTVLPTTLGKNEWRILVVMKRFIKFWQVIFLDTLGVLLIIIAPFTGVLPGPGGIPIFLIGLGLLAINHDWAQRYIDLCKKYADDIGEIIFVKNPKVQIAYDTIAPIMSIAGLYFLFMQKTTWMISLGVFLFFMGLTIFFGNRGRWKHIKHRVKRKR